MGRTFCMGFVAHTAGCGQAVHRCSHEGFKVVFEYSVDVGPVGGQDSEVLLAVGKSFLRALDLLHAEVEVPLARLQGVKLHVAPRYVAGTNLSEDGPHPLHERAVVVTCSREDVLRARQRAYANNRTTYQAGLQLHIPVHDQVGVDDVNEPERDAERFRVGSQRSEFGHIVRPERRRVSGRIDIEWIG